MKTVFVTIVIGLVWWVARHGALPTANAVVPEPALPVPAPASAAPVATKPLLPSDPLGAKPGAAETLPGSSDGAAAQRVEIPIAWQRTRAGMAGKGASTLTESFREVWTLELRPGGYLSLASPRARVPVFPASANEPRGALPHAVVLAEGDFARLVGVTSAKSGDAGEADQPEGQGLAGRPVTLNLAKSVRGGADITLAWSEDEHYAIHFDVASATLF